MQEIERRAEEVLAGVPSWIWDGDSLPVPIEDIVDSHFSLLVRDVEDMTSAPGAPELEPGRSLSGLLLASRGEIWVNAEEARRWPPRRRFTIGHELGHWCLHRPGQQSLFCRHGAVGPPPAPRDTTRPPLPVPEQEANAFAAALLMPARLVRRAVAQTGGDLTALCPLFDASAAAMERRLRALALVAS